MIRKKTYIGYADTVDGDGFSTTDKDKPYIGQYEGIDIDYILQTGGENLVINSNEDALLLSVRWSDFAGKKWREI